ncbi:hypothetical protein V8D89_011857 [Ganoderma adspersum]
MPPRKKLKTAHVQEGATAPTRRTTRTSSKAANAVTADTSDVQPPTVASMAPSVVKLQRGCFKEIPNFAVEIQLVNCGCPNIRKVVWPFFARYCSNCLPKVSSDSEDIVCRFLEAHCNIYLGFVLPSIRTSTQTNKPRHGYRIRKDKWYLNRHVDEFLQVEEWSGLLQPRDLDILKAFQTRRSDDVDVQGAYVLRCQYWHDRVEEDRKESLRDGRKDRFSAIVKKLMETGWAKDLDYLGPEGLEKMSRLPVVKQPAKLTDKGWTKVHEALHTFLNEARDQRLKGEREDVILERFAELEEAIVAHCVTIPRDATMECRPVALDLALQEELEPVANAPSSEAITRQTFAPLVPTLVAGSCSPRDRDLSDLPSSHYAAPAGGLFLAPYDLKSLEPKAVEVGIKWKHAIVAKLGLNPDTATLPCAEVEVQEHAYTWEAAFAHTAEHNTTYTHDAYPKSSHNRWSRVSKGDMGRVKQLEAVTHALTVDSNCQWSCALHNIVGMNGVVEGGTIFWSPQRNFNKVMKPAVKL